MYWSWLNLSLLDLTNMKLIARKKYEMINSLEEKVFGLTEKVEKLSSLVDGQEQHCRRNCILIHGVKENQNEDTD